MSSNFILGINIALAGLIFLSSYFALRGHLYSESHGHYGMRSRDNLVLQRSNGKNHSSSSRVVDHIRKRSDLSTIGITAHVTPALPIHVMDQEIFHDYKKHNLHEKKYIPVRSRQNNGTLVCAKHFVQQCVMYPYVRYWNTHFEPRDCFESPARHPLGKSALPEEQRYLIFEPDRGGWNNIRMAAETAMIFAHASGRVLVMPPTSKWYLLNKDKHGRDNEATFNKFFDLLKLRDSLDIMEMDEFLDKVARPGLLAEPYPMKYAKLATNRFAVDREELWRYLERACYTREWEPGKRFIGFNLSIEAGAVGAAPIFGDITRSPRLEAFAAHGRAAVPYDRTLHQQRAIFFPGDYRKTHRILTHFYSYLYWADPAVEHAYKRLARDRLRYTDDIFCAAGRAVQLLHKDAAILMKKPVQNPAHYHPKTNGGNSSRVEDATYFAYHIRRGDFQYRNTRQSAEEIYENTRHLLDSSITRLLYIATDEKNRDFFKPFHADFEVRFLSDFQEPARLTEAYINQNHIGMVEQIICASAHTFVGTPFSTFSGYITRLRGYYRDGRYKRSFYTLPQHMFQLHHSPQLVGPFWAREFAVAHNNIDDDVHELGIARAREQATAGRQAGE